MKTLGIGVDIVENRRFKNLVKNINFIKRTFGEKEIRLSQKVLNKSNYYSKRFAAKEAFAKSLGTGFRNNLNLVDIEILNDKKGKPYYIKSKKINNLVFKIFKIKKYNLFLSISDEKNYSIAFAIIQTF